MKIVRLCFVLAIVVCLAGCATAKEYRGESIEGWVVDKATSAPIEGAVIVARWALDGKRTPIDVQTHDLGDVMVMEAVTDGEGKFSFPAWGPVRYEGNGRVRADQPQLLAFKGGYRYWADRNGAGPEYWQGLDMLVIKSGWNGERIKLEKLEIGSEQDVIDFGQFAGLELNFTLNDPSQCKWKQIPKIIVAVADHRALIKKTSGREVQGGIDRALFSRAQFYDEAGKPRCGLPKEVLQGAGK